MRCFSYALSLWNRHRHRASTTGLVVEFAGAHEHGDAELLHLATRSHGFLATHGGHGDAPQRLNSEKESFKPKKPRKGMPYLLGSPAVILNCPPPACTPLRMRLRPEDRGERRRLDRRAHGGARAPGGCSRPSRPGRPERWEPQLKADWRGRTTTPRPALRTRGLRMTAVEARCCALSSSFASLLRRASRHSGASAGGHVLGSQIVPRIG